MKIAIRVGAALVLLFVGYSAGLLVQFQRDIRLNAAMNIDGAIKLHKQLSVGSYGHALHDTETDLGAYLHNARCNVGLSDLPGLLRGGAFDQFQTDWRDGAFAAAVGLHRDRPDIAFPSDVKLSLESFVPRNKVVQVATDYYAHYQPAQ